MNAHKIDGIKRTRRQVASFYERDALANEVRVANSVDLKLSHSLRKKARDMRVRASQIAVKLSLPVATRH